MADDQFLRSPTNPHFFQPLLSSFHTHLNIPVTFFLKHVQGNNDHIKIAKLRTDASAKIWLVKINGLRFTDGWEEFAAAHELRIGDIIIFRYEREMVFHVTIFGPSFCDIQYTLASSHNINEDSDKQTNNTGNSSEEKRKSVKKTPRTTKNDSSSDHSHFMARVSSCSLRFDRLYVPISFSRSNGLDNMSGKEIVLLNEEGRSWNLNITTYTKATMQTFVGPGWRRFCAENGMSQGHQYSVKLVRRSAPPVIRLSVGEPAPESSLHPSYYVGSVSSNNLRRNKLYLQRKFVNANGLKGFSEIILKNERGGRWILGLRYYESLDHTYLGPGWNTFCQVNGIKAGDSFMLRVVETEDKPVLLLCSPNRGKTPLEFPEDSDDVNSLSSDTSSGDDSREESQGSEEESLGDEGSSQESFEMEKRKSSSRCGASSSYSQDRFVKLTLTPRVLQTYQLALPLGFTRVNGINKPGKITLLDKDGVKKQVVDLLQKSTNDRIMRLGQGWREFCNTHGVKVGQSFVLELIWDDEEAIPVLKFCTKLPQPAPECSIQHSCHVGSVSSNSLRTDKLYLKRKFVTANGLEGFSEVTLKNERGGTWSLGLRYYESLDHTYLRQGWKTFCQENGIKAKDSIMLKLVETGDKPVLLCTSNRGKTKCSEDSDDVNSLSSSYSQERFVKLTLTPRALKTYKLMLPLSFTRVNGINKPGKITLLDKDGVKKQVVDLLDQNRNTGIMRLGQGWREFCDGHGVKVGESFVLELIWEDEEAIPVLKFCTKL